MLIKDQNIEVRFFSTTHPPAAGLDAFLNNPHVIPVKLVLDYDRGTGIQRVVTRA